jgi:hypothetical protein
MPSWCAFLYRLSVGVSVMDAVGIGSVAGSLPSTQRLILLATSAASDASLLHWFCLPAFFNRFAFTECPQHMALFWLYVSFMVSL